MLIASKHVVGLSTSTIKIVECSGVMFFSPRIAPNTGNAIRMVAATGCELHLVEPLGFDLSEPKLRRAGLDYHDLASVTVHADLDAAWDGADARSGCSRSPRTPTASFADVAYQPGDVLMFGPEPTGLDAATLADPHITAQVRIPMLAGRRSLNLSNAAAVAVYEAWRQQGFAGVSRSAARRAYQVFQWVSCSAGSRLAGLKSVPLV